VGSSRDNLRKVPFTLAVMKFRGLFSLLSPSSSGVAEGMQILNRSFLLGAD
jgi:hypothetical protein